MSQEISDFSSSRRDFLRNTGLATAGLVIGFYVPVSGRRALALAAEPAAALNNPNAFISIAPDNAITLTINHLEMGQGIFTSMSQLIAEELECDWSKIRAVAAPVDAVYNTPMGMQMTGGSSSLISSYDQYRNIGATLRYMLTQAAAKRWGVSPESCHAENGFIVSSKGRLSYGDLAHDAAAVLLPKEVKLKDPKEYKVIGRAMARVDAVEKSTGKAVYGIDVRLPNMLYAVVQRPPLPNTKLLSFDEAAARKVDGVKQVVRFGDSVAVLAGNTWTARVGRDALNAKYNMQGHEKMDSDELFSEFKKAIVSDPGRVVDNRGDVNKAFKKAHTKIAATYEFPYLAHACMEPMNCTISFDGHKAEIWSGHQMPTMDQAAAAQVLGIAKEKVQVHTVYAGGSFGRRGNKNCDYVVEAAALAKIVKKPLKIVWTREDDMHGGYYRPMNVHQATLAFDSKNHFLGWTHQIAGQTVVGGSPLEKFIVKDGIESLVVEGVAGTPYKIDNFHVDYRRPTPNMTTLWWRSVGHSHTCFVTETIIDEIAHQMKKDSLELRREWLKSSPRHLAVLDLLAKHSPWGKAAPKGHAYGMAIHQSFNSVVGHVVEVSNAAGNIKVHRVWSAVDCGQVVNPDGAKAQIEGAFVFGYSAALSGEIVIKNGQVTTNNFNDYQVMRMPEMPKIEVFFVDSHAHPTGLGEPGLPAVAPAIANAMFRLNGKRLRKLPFSRSQA